LANCYENLRKRGIIESLRRNRAVAAIINDILRQTINQLVSTEIRGCRCNRENRAESCFAFFLREYFAAGFAKNNQIQGNTTTIGKNWDSSCQWTQIDRFQTHNFLFSFTRKVFFNERITEYFISPLLSTV
jgi:hypothetical protein